MSKTVDERIVEMRIEKEQFERGAEQVMRTMGKLKDSTNFDASSDSIDRLQRRFGGFDASPMANALDHVQAHFSALEVAGMRVISNLTDSIYNFTANTLKSFTIDPISTGWGKFGEKTTSVSTLTAQGYELEKVNDLMEQLNWFTDETSYNFTDMVGNIAKFTATGQDLDSSVTAMEGIALWAALSGQNAQKASMAMYQLSQAMGKGALKYDDYKSIQNASMDTQEFRKQAVAAAEALGVLKKVGEGTWATLEAPNKVFSLSELFSSEGLSRQQWFTSDVMMKVFNQYSKGVAEIQRYMAENGLDTASEAMEALEADAQELAESVGITLDEAFKQLGYDIDEFSLKAFKAGQQARTWTDVVDSVKDAVSTGWMTTFETLFGTAEDATEFWTSLANKFYDIFAEGGNIRNQILKIGFGYGVDEEKATKAATDGWTKFEQKITASGRSMEQFETSCRNVIDATENMSVDALIKQYGSLKDAFQQGAVTGDMFRQILQNLTETTEDTTTELSENMQSTEQSLEELKEVARGIIRGDYGNGSAQKAMLEELGYNYELVQGLAEIMYNNGQGYIGITEELLKTQYPTFYAMLQAYGVSTQAVIDSLNDTLADSDAILEDIQTNVIDLSGDTKDIINEIKGSKLFKGALENFVTAFQNVQEAWRSGVENVFGSIEERGAKVYQFLVDFNSFSERILSHTTEIDENTSKLDGFQQVLENVFRILKSLGSLIKPIGELFYTFGSALFSFGKGLISGLLGDGVIADDVQSLTGEVGKLIRSVSELIEDKIPDMESIGTKIGRVISVITGHVSDLFKNVKWLLANTAVIALDFLGSIFPSFQDKTSQASAWIKETFGILEHSFGRDAYDLPSFQRISQNLLAIVRDTIDDIGNVFGHEGLGTQFDEFIDKISNFFVAIQDFFSGKGFGNVQINTDLATTESHLSKISGWIDNLKTGNFSLLDLFKSDDGGALLTEQGLDKIFPSSEGIESESTTFVDKITAALTSKFSEITWDDVTKVGWLALIGLIAYRIDSFAASVTNLLNPKKWGFTNVTNSVAKFINSISGSFNNLSKSVKMKATGEMILKVAEAIGILAASMWALSLIPEDSFYTVVGGLSLILFLISRIAKNFSAGETKITNVFDGFGDVLDDVKNKLVSLRPTFNLIPAAMGAMIGLAAVIAAAAYAIVALKDVSWEQAGLGITVATGVFTACIALLGIMKDVGDKAKGAGGLMVGLAAAFAVTTFVIAKLGEIKMENFSFGPIITAVVAFAGLLAALALIGNLSDKHEGMTKAAASVLLLSVAFGMLSASLIVLSLFDTNSILGAGLALMLIAVAIDLVLIPLGVFQKKSSELIKGAAAVAILAAAIGILVPALAILSLFDFVSLIGAAGALGVMALALAGVLAVLTLIPADKAMPAAIAFGILAAAVALLSGAMVVFGAAFISAIMTIPWDKFTENVEKMDKALRPEIGLLLTIGSAVLMFGVGVASAALGVGVFGISLVAVSAGILLIITALAKLPEALEGIVKSVQIFKEHSSEILEFVGVLLGAVALAIIAKKLQLSKAVIEVVIAVIGVLASAPTLTKLIDSLATIIEFVINWLIDKIQWIIDKLVEIVVKIVNGLANSIHNNSTAIATAFGKLITAIVEVFLKALTSAIGGVMSGIAGIFGQAISKFGNFLGDTKIGQWIGEKLGINFDWTSAESWGEKLRLSTEDLIGDMDFGFASAYNWDEEIEVVATKTEIAGQRLSDSGDAYATGANSFASNYASGTSQVNAALADNSITAAANAAAERTEVAVDQVRAATEYLLAQKGVIVNQDVLETLTGEQLRQFQDLVYEIVPDTSNIDVEGAIQRFNSDVFGEIVLAIEKPSKEAITAAYTKLQEVTAAESKAGAEKTAEGIQSEVATAFDTKSKEITPNDIAKLIGMDTSNPVLDGVVSDYLQSQGLTDLNEIPGISDLINANGFNVGNILNTGVMDSANSLMPTLGTDVFGLFGDSFMGEGNSLIPGMSFDLTSLMGSSITEEGNREMPITGNNLIDGLIWAIRDRFGDIRAAGYDSALEYQAGFDEASRIASPSKEMVKRGNYLLDGLLLPMEKRKESVYGIASSFADGMISAIGDAMSKVAMLSDEDLEYTPRITPIVDLSSAANSVSQIRGMFGGVAIRSALQAAGSIGNVQLSGATLNYTNQNAPVTSAIHDLSKRMDRFSKAIDEDRNFNVDIRVDNLAVRDDRDIQAISKQLAREVRVALRQKGTR